MMMRTSSSARKGRHGSHAGYIKRSALSTYRAQRRGGKGSGTTRDEDFVAPVVRRLDHAPCCSSPRSAKSTRKVWRLPLAARKRAKSAGQLLPLEQGERFTSSHAAARGRADWAGLDVMFATTRGTVRRNKLSISPRSIAPQDRHEARSRRGIVDVQMCRKTTTSLTTAGQASASPCRKCGCSRAAIHGLSRRHAGG